MASARTCISCNRTGPVELEMKVASGDTLTMLSCPRCEGRHWLVNGEPADVDAVLRTAAGDADFVVTPSKRSGRGARGRASR